MRKILILSLVIGTQILMACALPLPPITLPSPAANDTTPVPEVPAGETVNVAALARLGETERIEVEAFAESPSPGYQTAATITESDEITQIVETLNTPLALLPRVTCVDQYRLRFIRADGTVHEFGYFCDDNNAFLHGDLPFLQGYDVQPPASFRELLEQKIAQ